MKMILTSALNTTLRFMKVSLNIDDDDSTSVIRALASLLKMTSVIDHDEVDFCVMDCLPLW